MKVVCFFVSLLISNFVFSQDFDGQWRGSFNETSYGFSGLGSNVDYVLEIQTSGSKVSGYSYTYFNEAGKRYYTICKLTGIVDRTAKEITVTEIERVKFNTPENFQNCFQVHRLHYTKDTSDLENLSGTWIPAPNQTGNCGYGSTLLSRKIEKKYAALPLPKKNENKPSQKSSSTAKNITPKKAPAKKPLQKKPTTSNNLAKNIVPKKEEGEKGIPSITPQIRKTDTIAKKINGFEPRRKDIIKTIAITQPTFKVDFYDNGEIDGDSITVFYNNKIVLSHKMLSAKAISLTLALDDNVKENVITMYADNLGTIPPNTALMIVTDGDKRYEVRIESDTQKSGSVVFVHGDKK